jgi:uncharacterized membrane protein
VTNDAKAALSQSQIEAAVLPNGEKAIEAEISKIVPNLPPEKLRLVATAAMEIVVQHSGPLPPPQILAGYDQVLPGLADRIVSMAESDLRHHQDMQKTALDGEISERKMGQIGGTLVTIVALVISAWVAVSGYPVLGGGLASLTLLGIVTTLIGGREWLIAKAFSLSKKPDRAPTSPSKKKRK